VRGADGEVSAVCVCERLSSTEGTKIRSIGSLPSVVAIEESAI